MKRVLIDEFLSQSRQALVIDVRSPAEFAHAHIPGAVSLPLFTDEERKVVGTAYKQKSREEAIKIGLDYFGPKMRGMVEEVEKMSNLKLGILNLNANIQPETRNSKTEIFLYCWRGGMRSSAVAWLLNLYGFNVTLLAGGYKAFRNHVLKSFEQPYHFKIIGGYTGSGKTEVLHQLQKDGEQIIDLEKIASHKGSAFGNINMPPQPTQEMFENLLSTELCNASGKSIIANDKVEDTAHNAKSDTPNCLWLEDESQRIGNLNIPGALWRIMRESEIYFLDVPFEERLEHISEEYSKCPKEKLQDAIERIKKRLGPLETKTSLQYLEEDNLKECFRILLHYYDKHYLKALSNRENLENLLTKIHCQTISTENAGLVLQVKIKEQHSYAGKN